VQHVFDEEEVIPPPPDLPLLEVTEPARGAFLPGPVTVRGSAVPGTGTLSSLEANDLAVDWDDQGGFEEILDPGPGLLILGVRLEDDLGERAVDGRAVQVGPVYSPGAVVPRAIGLQLGPEVLDDDAADIDDLARIAELAVEDPEFSAAFVGTTFSGDSYDVELTSMSLEWAEIDLAPTDGVLLLDTVLHDVFVTFDATALGFLTVSGWASMDQMSLAMDLSVHTTSGGVQVEALSAAASIQGFDWDVEWVPGWVEDLLKEGVVSTMEDGLEDQALELVDELVGETLEAFALDTTFGDDDEMRLVMGLSAAEVAREGLVVWMDASVSASRPGVELPPGAGSLRTDGPPASLPRSTSAPVLAVVDDDLVNQGLFAIWAGGTLTDLHFSGPELLLMTGGESLPPPIGPVAQLAVDGLLPPVLAPPSGALDMDLAIGELWFDLLREDGERLTVSLNVSTGADLVVDGSGAITVSLDTRPVFMNIQAGMIAWPEGLDPGDLASLFRLSTPSLLGKSTALLPGFPAPEIPIGEMFDLPALNGVTWVLSDLDAQMEASGWSEMTAVLEEG